jgi:YjbE family integral membrane protein
MTVDSTFLLALLQIIWINILLSGDNAVVIALACRSLPPRERRIGVMLGAGAAVVLRIIFTMMVVWLMEIPYLKLIGGVLLLWIAVKLLTDETDEASVKESDTIWNAVRTVAIADMVMSLDNVIAIAAAAQGSTALIIFGLCLSVPLIVFGATLVITLLQRYPLLVWAGAGLLGWVAGSIMVSDPGWHSLLGAWPHLVDEVVGGSVGVVFVLALAWALRKRAAAAHGVNEEQKPAQ